MNLEAILKAVNARKNRVLLIAQSSLPDTQFQAFRRLFLDEFGQSGLERDLGEVMAGQKHGMDRHGRA